MFFRLNPQPPKRLTGAKVAKIFFNSKEKFIFNNILTELLTDPAGSQTKQNYEKVTEI